MSALSKRRHDGGDTIRKKFEQGLRLQAQDRHAEAVARFRKVLATCPNDMDALKGLCQSLIATGRPQEAVDMLDGIATGIENREERLDELARVCIAIKHFRLAEKLYERVLAISPDAPIALVNLANLLDERGELQRAADLLSHALELNPNAATAYAALGRVLTRTAQFDEAVACYRRSIECDPGIAQTYTNLAALFESMGRHGEALAALQQALNLDADCDAARWNLARALLTVGEIEAGWDMYGFGFACGQRLPWRPFPGLIWEGEDLADKTIMVWREQGLGDDLLFSTCYSDLIARAGHVIIETERRLVSLYQRTWPEATVRAETWTSTGLDNYGEVDFDYTAPAGLVAAQLRRKLTDFPSSTNGLKPDPARIAECRTWLETLGTGPKIGISWTSGKVDDIRSLNYTKLADWKGLFAIEGTAIVNLQYTDISEEAEALQRDHGLTLHRMPGLDLRDDLEGVAALTACMDAVVAPSSFPAMMTGTLNRPCYHYRRTDWPMLGSGRLPWFPQMRCYMIDDTGTRANFVNRIVTDLGTFLRT